MASRRVHSARALPAALAALLTTGLAACSSNAAKTTGTPAGSHSATAPRRGGSLTALVSTTKAGNWSSGLDPATNTIGYNTQLQAIYGGLFLLRADDDGSNARVVPNQAKSASFGADSKTLTITLRPGMTFSDGTPFDADAVIWNFRRDFDPQVSGSVPLWKVRAKDPFTSPDPLTVVIHLAQPNASLVNNFPYDRTNWIASPTAFTKMGEKRFRVTPVGAGPFTVVSDTLSATLVLKRNPKFFKADQGLPYLDRLTFTSVGGNDQSAYQAILAGDADTYVGMSSPSLIKQAESDSRVTVTIEPATQPETVQFNTLVPPFNNKKAREAVYYATDFATISKGVFNGIGVQVQSFTTPNDLFYHRTVPGYRTYDLERAKGLVRSLGGLRFTIFTSDTPGERAVLTALQTQWERAGMHVQIKPQQIATNLKTWRSGKWQASLVHIGNFDPASGLGLSLWFNSHSPYAGMHDPVLDGLIQRGATTVDATTRDQVYRQVGKYLSDNAYAVFGLAVPDASVVAAGVRGPGLTTKIPGGLSLIPIWTEAWK